MSAKSEGDARKAVVGMILGVIVVETVLVAVAIFGAGIYWGDPAFMASPGNFDDTATETIILQVARHNLPLVAGLLLLVGGVAIIFSTATTFLMIPSTNLTRDVYQRFISPEASQKKLVLFQRLTIVALAAISLVVTNFFESILDMALYAYTMVGAAVTPAVLAAFLWRRVTPLAGTVSVAAGMLVTVVFGALHTLGIVGWGYDLIIYPAAAASILSLIVLSYFTPPSPEAKWRPFWS